MVNCFCDINLKWKKGIKTKYLRKKIYEEEKKCDENLCDNTVFVKKLISFDICLVMEKFYEKIVCKPNKIMEKNCDEN